MSKPFVLELSISDATDENKLSENLAHRESTNTHQYDPDASIHDQDDNALDSDSDSQSNMVTSLTILAAVIKNVRK